MAREIEPNLDFICAVDFETVCRVGALLLRKECVSGWLYVRYPVVVVDEFQDCKSDRLAIIQAIESCCHVVAAADEYQDLQPAGLNPAVEWLHGSKLALVITLGRAAELLPEQVMTLQLGEGSGLQPLAVAQDPRHRQRGVVIQNPRRYAAKIGKGSYVSFEKSFHGLGGKCHYEAIVGMEQVEGKIVRLTLHSGNHDQGFPEVGLCFTWRVAQRHEHPCRTQE